jgi:hypothetical protein
VSRSPLSSPDVIVPEAQQIPVPDLPEGETLVFLLGSRYCETDRLRHAVTRAVDLPATGRSDTALDCRDQYALWATETGVRNEDSLNLTPATSTR